MGMETRLPHPHGGSPAEVPDAKSRDPNLTAEASLPARLCPISARVGHGLSREIDAYPRAHGVTRSRAAAEYLDIASEVFREREGIPNGRADELLGSPFPPRSRARAGARRPHRAPSRTCGSGTGRVGHPRASPSGSASAGAP
jgi:hypothetical protein